VPTQHSVGEIRGSVKIGHDRASGVIDRDEPSLGLFDQKDIHFRVRA
jgi:hypothetical protein